MTHFGQSILVTAAFGVLALLGAVTIYAYACPGDAVGDGPICAAIVNSPPWGVLAAVVTAPTVLLVWYWSAVHRDREVQDRDREVHTGHELSLANRFADAVRLLSDTRRLESRLGAIYSLEFIAQESKQDRRSVLETLSAFVREHATGPGRPQMDEAHGEEKPGPATDIQAALTVISRVCKKYAFEKIEMDLRGVQVAHASLIEARLRGFNWNGASLENAALQRAVLREAHLEEANLKKAQLRGARLEVAQLRKAILENALLEGARLNGTNLNWANMRGAKLQGAQLPGAIMYAVILQNAEMQDAHLEGAILRKAHLDGANLEGANLEGAVLQEASVGGTDFTSAILTGADLRNVDLTRTIGLDVNSLVGAKVDCSTTIPPGLLMTRSGARSLGTRKQEAELYKGYWRVVSESRKGHKLVANIKVRIDDGGGGLAWSGAFHENGFSAEWCCYNVVCWAEHIIYDYTLRGYDLKPGEDPPRGSAALTVMKSKNGPPKKLAGYWIMDGGEPEGTVHFDRCDRNGTA